MTSTPGLLPEARPSLLDRFRGRLEADPVLARRWSWLAPTLITLLAGILRFWNLGHPHDLVFDETYYVKDAWSQWNLGFPTVWPEGANERFITGETGIFESDASFVVHPPLGRLFIGAGMALFGADSSFGWRFAVAVFGTASVLVLYFFAKSLTRSIVFASVAALLMAIDGLAIVMSRVGLLDGILVFFMLLAFWFVVKDRDGHLDRLATVIAARSADSDSADGDSADGDSAEGGSADRIAPMWGPVLWNRPWLVAAGVAAGAATAVKWSGLYVIAGLGIYVVVTDALARRRAGIGQWPMDAVRQGAASFVLFVPIAFVVYLASWASWLFTDGGYDRHAVDEAPATGLWGWVPLPLQNLWAFHQAMYGFHVGLTSDHGYESPAWQWPLLLRPTSMYFHQDAFGEPGCGAVSGCVQNIYSMPNPLIWYAGVAAVLYLVYRFIVKPDWRFAVVLTGVGVTYAPWLLFPDRTIFQFYTVAILPFLILALTFALQAIAGPPSSDGTGADAYRRLTGQRVVIVFLIVAIALSALWYPILTATQVPYDFWRLHNWMQSWV